MNVAIESYDAHPSVECGVVDHGLGEFNDAAAPLHEVKPMACLARSEDASVVGGAIGRRWGTCAELQQLWVAEGHRAQGVGRSLMSAFEKLAISHGITNIFLETFSFQATDFYQKLGYTVAYENIMFPHGIAKYHMVKYVTDQL